MFLAVISYVLGVFMETFIPRRGLLRYLNPVSQAVHLCCFVYKGRSIGTVQQERDRFCCHHGKRFC